MSTHKYLLIFLFTTILLLIGGEEVSRLSEAELNLLVENVLKIYRINIDKDLILAVIMTESSGNPKADSGFARGLMQVSRIALFDINNKYKFNYTYDDLFEPAINIQVGTLYLRDLVKYYKTKYPDDVFVVSYSVMAYNSGIGFVNDWLKNTKADNRMIDESIPEETKSHLLDVMWWYFHFKDNSKSF